MHRGKYDKAEDIVNRYLETPYVKTYGEDQAFALLSKIQNLKDTKDDLKEWSDDEINMLSRKNIKYNKGKDSKNTLKDTQANKAVVSDKNENSKDTGIANEENDVIEEISNLEQELGE